MGWSNKSSSQEGKFIVINAHTQKKERPQINNITLYLKKIEKRKKLNSKLAKERK